MQEYRNLIDAALAAGAAKATVIPVEQIVLSADFYKICESNGCGNFGRCWMCPPYLGHIEDLMAKVRTYGHGLLYQTIAEIEDSFDIEGMFDAGRDHALLSQRLEKDASLPAGHLHLSCGGCRLCERCAKKDDQPCRFPDQAMASMEGYGIDVYNTTKGTELKYINGANTVTYFGIVLF